MSSIDIVPSDPPTQASLLPVAADISHMEDDGADEDDEEHDDEQDELLNETIDTGHVLDNADGLHPYHCSRSI